MKIGTDISIAECRVSGYMVMDFKKSDLIKNGRLDKDCSCELTVSNPEEWTDSGRANPAKKGQLYVLNEDYSFNDLLKIIKDEGMKKSIASICDWENCQPELENPTERDMLNLASDIHFVYNLSHY